MPAQPQVTVAVEGDLDERIARRLVAEAGGDVARVYGRRGKEWLRQQIGGYRNASMRSPWFVLVDLDSGECPPRLREEWGIAADMRGMCFRVAVRAVESWLLADRDGLARLLGVARGGLPDRPDAAPDPKRALIDAARRSRRSRVRDAILPRPGARQGPLYTATLGRFADERWSPAAAAELSPSLASCRRRLSEFLAAPYASRTAVP